MSDGLILWLRAQLDLDERLARYSGGTGHWSAEEAPVEPGAVRRFRIVEERHPVAHVDGSTRAEHVARWDPQRVLAEVEAKRRIINEFAATDETTGSTSFQLAARRTLRWLAEVYADRPGYREEWRP